ncbi:MULTISPECIES: hypothetical protein [unclassified Rhodococcus (in: high G+C Gram-positive bacteria)]|uniref:hypothetical protein n=1 Tax=unclassified Rhodococcus (in: high G+C Gram-positive bacteria) TaxID=192944 RepID=UPI0015963106|nr:MULTISPECIES: hypothetical protein [unclassified Rhodococcus (in: high G+C Gram-positive bacteria)]
MTDTLIARALDIDPAEYDLPALLRDAEISLDPRGRHAVLDDDEVDLLREFAARHRLPH